MNRDQALSKIKKCLALAASSNPHEAAAGARQAQKLMAEHGLNETDVQLSDVATQACATPTNSQPLWEVSLASAIGDAFGCDSIWSSQRTLIGNRSVRKCKVIFIGIGAAAQIAGYAWDVLSRQCAKARLAHIRKQPARCKPITLTARGDEFAFGWVMGVREKLEAFAAPERNVLLIEQYKAVTWPETSPLKVKDRSVGRNVSRNDFHQGALAGKSADLNRGVNAGAAQGLLS